MKVTTLIENSPSPEDPRLAFEWGLSLHIAVNGRSLLFDTGASGSFAKNAEHLSVGLASVDAAVLSHHHYDHGGGLRRFFEINSSAAVHLGEAPEGECAAKLFGFVRKYAGLDRTLLADHAGRFKTVTGPAEILPGVYLFPHVPGTHPTPAGNRHLFLRRGHTYTPDTFAHEIVMAIKEDGKLVVFTGCSHSGVLNMVDTVAKELGNLPVKAVVGGFHLVSMPPFNVMADRKGDVQDLARALLRYPVERAYTGHCTGKKAFGVLKAVMGERIAQMRTGSCFEV